MRHDLTWAEKLLWHQLRNRKLEGLKFRRQQPLGSYILDFYCPDKFLVVELDGGQHDIPEEREYDLRRTEFLKNEGLEVLRFWNSQMRENLPWVLELIRRKAGVSTTCEPETPHPNPLPQGERVRRNNKAETPHPNPLPQGEREWSNLLPRPLGERVGVRGIFPPFPITDNSATGGCARGAL